MSVNDRPVVLIGENGEIVLGLTAADAERATEAFGRLVGHAVLSGTSGKTSSVAAPLVLRPHEAAAMASIYRGGVPSGAKKAARKRQKQARRANR